MHNSFFFAIKQLRVQPIFASPIEFHRTFFYKVHRQHCCISLHSAKTTTIGAKTADPSQNKFATKAKFPLRQMELNFSISPYAAITIGTFRPTCWVASSCSIKLSRNMTCEHSRIAVRRHLMRDDCSKLTVTKFSRDLQKFEEPCASSSDDAMEMHWWKMD